MKNAYVLSHHHGDSGTATEGMILADLTDQRFNALEKKGLVREATAAEVKAGHQVPFEAGGETIGDEAAEKQAEKPENKKAAEPENKQAAKPATKAK